jgi:hemoglobin-like flavoprotein
MFGRRRKETNVSEAQQTPAKTDPRWVRSADDKARAEDAITEAQANSNPPWRAVPGETDEVQLRRKGDSSTTLGAWSQGPTEVRDMQPPPLGPDDTVVQDRPAVDTDTHVQALRRPADATVIREVPIAQTPFAARWSVPKQLVSSRRESCEHCGGTGFMPGISDHLRESISLLGNQGDEVVRTFYRMLFRTAPGLVALFPADPSEGDLGTDHRGAQQREKLLQALVALSDLYDPDDAEKMDRLDRALQTFGRSHAAFARADGTIRGATLEEYVAVKDALFTTLLQAAGHAWKAEYTESWSQAYDYATGIMLAEQYRSGFSAPRFPRA